MGLYSWLGWKQQDTSKDEIIQNLSPEQQQYFAREDLKLHIETNKAASKENPKVNNDTLHTPEEKRALEEFKRENTTRAAVLENCAEVQMMLMQCLKTGTYREKATMCNSRTQALFNCIEKQKTALALLGYESSRSIDEAQHIKGISDDLFVEFYGKDGLEVGENKADKFQKKLEHLEIKLWK